MATSLLDIVNLTLDDLGEPRATSIDDESSWVERLVDIVPARARLLLADYPWNFAEKLFQLAGSEPTPDDWALGCPKPPTWLRTNVVRESADPEGEDIPYTDRGSRILINASGGWLWYVDAEYIDLIGAWPQTFCDAVAAHSALAAAPSTSTSKEKTDRLERLVRFRTAKAQTWDAQQKPMRRPSIGNWARARLRGTALRDGRRG